MAKTSPSQKYVAQYEDWFECYQLVYQVAKEVARLEKENRKQNKKLKKAETIICLQHKYRQIRSDFRSGKCCPGGPWRF